MAIQRWEELLTPQSPEREILGKIIQPHISLLSTKWCWVWCQVKMISQFSDLNWQLGGTSYPDALLQKLEPGRVLQVWYRACFTKYSLHSLFLFSHLYSQDNVLLNSSCSNFSWTQYLLLWSSFLLCQIFFWLTC